MVAYSEKVLEELRENGYAVIKNFISHQKADRLKKEARKLVENMPKPKDRIRFNPSAPEGYQARFDSCDKISYFYEPEVLDEEGNSLVDPLLAVNKIGYGLHLHNEVFRKEIFNDSVEGIIRDVGYEKPVIIQSLLTFKNSKIGGMAPPHQDTTYMICDPPKVVGFYIALDDATEDNGCVWFLRGSHKDGIRRIMKRNINSKSSNDMVVFDKPPLEYDLDEFDCVPCKKGDAILFDGNTVHYTGPNNTESSRDAFVFQIMETKDVVWSKDNWAQPPKGFESLYSPAINA